MGQNEDCSLEEASQMGSEKLLQKDGQESQCIHESSEEGHMQSSTQLYIFAKVWLLVTPIEIPTNDFSTFLDMRRCKNLGS